jgi:Fur family ferric uptake transcriptional regulator
LNASQIFQYLDGTIHRATIYRSLHYLESHDYVHGFTLHCNQEGTTRFYFPFGESHIHFFHCKNCHRFFPYEDCLLKDRQEETKDKYNFTVDHHVLFFLGTCESCEKPVGNEKKMGDASNNR